MRADGWGASQIDPFRTFGLAYEIRSFGGEWPSLEARMAAIRDLPKLSSSCTTVIIAGYRPAAYCASIQVFDPTSLTATFEKETRSGLPLCVPR